jgi:RNA polymerase sigma-70 factor (ECF subfamily)
MLTFVPWTTARAADPAPLLARLARGDAGALDQLYRREAGPVYRYAMALCGNPAWAADATQDAFVALATRPDGFDAGRGSLGAYLAGIARNTLKSRWRDARSEEPLDDDGDVDAGADPAPSPEALLVRAQASARVWQGLRALPAAMREAVVLVDLQERPYAEAAQIAGIELNTLRTRLHRARLRLAALLAGRGDRDDGR